MKVRITKLTELEDAVFANNIEEGYVVEKEVNKLPYVTLGERVTLGDEKSFFSTSPVSEIIDENTFKTCNSIYKMEII